VIRTLLIIALVAYVLYWIKSATKKGGKKRIPPRAVDSLGEHSPHEVLGVEVGASQEEIRRAYQQRVQQYHPDRVANMADELRELAEQRTKEINAAYDALTRS